MHIRAAGFDADLTQHLDRGVAHDLVFFVSEGLRWRYRNRVAGVDAHRVKVLNRTDDNAVVFAVADHFHFELFPAYQ